MSFLTQLLESYGIGCAADDMERADDKNFILWLLIAVLFVMIGVAVFLMLA